MPKTKNSIWLEKYPSEYQTWLGMKRRCYEKGRKDYKHYGGRGIKICPRWLHSFALFLNDMKPKPGKGYSIERQDNDGDYEPGNCYWATREEQVNNRRNTVFVNLPDGRFSAGEVARRFGISHKRVIYKIRDLEPGTVVDKEFFFEKKIKGICYPYNGKLLPLKTIADLAGIPHDTLHHRVYHNGMSAQEAADTPVRVYKRAK